METKILTFLIIIGLGYVLKKIGFLKEDGANFLRSLVFNVTLPPLVFLGIRGAELSIDLLKIPLVVWVSVVFLGLLIYLITLLLKLPPELRAILVLVGVMGNTTFLGYPVVRAVLGEGAMPYAIIYDQASWIFLIVLWLPVVALVGSKSRRDGATIIRDLFKAPPFLALVAGLLLRSITFPAFFMDSLGLLAQLTAPLVMLYLGSTQKLSMQRKEILIVVVVVILKQLMFPLINFALASLLGVHQLILSTVILQSSMPVMIATIIYGAQVGLNVSLISKIVTMSTIISPITLILISHLTGLSQ